MGGFGGQDEILIRPQITDQQGVHSEDPSMPNQLVVLDSDAEVIDLLGEGEIEGLVSGTYSFQGEKGYTGYFTGESFTAYTATGLGSDNPQTSLGFLRSVYWNNTPVVDQNGYYNFTNINLEYTKGIPEGNLAKLNTNLPASESLDLTVERNIGERLYGISVQGGTQATNTVDAGNLANDSRIDAVAKTYTILNNECTKAQLRIRVSQLFEQIRSSDAPKDYKKDSKPAPVGYGDIKAREIRYNIYYQPIFDFYSDEINGEIPLVKAWTFYKTEIVEGHVDQIYIRSTTINFSENYIDQPGFAGWSIKVIRTTPESLTAYLKNVSFVDSIVEIYGTKLRYPYSSMVYSKFDAEFFTRIPSRSYDTRLTKVKIPNNYNPILKTYGRSDAVVVTSWPTVNINTALRKGQKVYFRGGQILIVGQGYNAGNGQTIAGTWERTGTQTPFGSQQRNYPDVNGEVGATTEGYIPGSTSRMGTDANHYWDGGFKEIESWGAGQDAPTVGGGSIIEKKWSDNPAWCFYDLITNPRYGLGDFIDKNFLDKWALYEIAQYCDVLVPDGKGSIEPRFAMNHLIVSREEAYKVVNDLSSVFRGITYYANGLIYAVQDSFKKALYQFNNTNVVDGGFNYSSSSKKARHSVAVVRYIDKFNLYTPAVEYVEHEDSIKRYGIRQIETTALGSTSRGQARRFGEWLLISEAEETESVSFTVGQDGAYLRPGDVVQIYDQFRTPLNFRGRTNAVLTTGVAPSNITYPYPDNAGADYPVTGNSVIVDAPVSFTKDKIYKFSLLTPTYNYDSTGISDLNSDDDVKRTSVQDLYFLGNHTQTLSGYYNSPYEEGGSGIVTQIYFHTGLRLQDGSPIGTGNQLDFENYVITGYTNNYVNGSVKTSYSGGCFSGANLVWSAETNDQNDDEYISGHFANFRVINVTENDDSSSYAVSALAYASGKYDQVEERLSFQNISIDDTPLWPHILYDATNVKKGINDFASIELASPNEKDTVGQTDSEKLFEPYSTFEIRVPQVSTTLKPGADQGTAGAKYVDLSPEYTFPKRMSYQICIVEQDELSNGFGDPTLALSNSLFTVDDYNKKVRTILHPVSSDNYAAYYRKSETYLMDGDPAKKATTDGFATSNKNEDLGTSFFMEKLLTKDTNYWIAVFAVNNYTRSTEAVIGLILSSNYVDSNNYFVGSPILENQIPKGENFNIVRGLNINNLTSPDLASPTIIGNQLNPLTTTQPVFNWNTTTELDFRDDFNKPLELPSSQEYRITVRSTNDQEAFDDYTPSNDIFMELTGYTQPRVEAAFTFIYAYNNPHAISNLHNNSDAQKYDANGTKNASLSQKATSWYRIDNSGVIFKNSPNNFPLRDFDIVVEAHDGFGNTSAGNSVWDNTIAGADTSNVYSQDENGLDGYGLLRCSIGVPSGIIFAQFDKTASNRVDDYSFLSPSQAFTREYPYLATAEIFTNGELHLKMQPSVDEAGNIMITEAGLQDAFPDVRGLVYYYSTGDNSTIDFATEEGLVIFQPNNKAPNFELKKEFMEPAFNNGFQGNVKYLKADGVTPGEYPNVPAVVDGDMPGNVTVHRGYHLFASSTNPANIVIPFPKIAAGNVQNIYLTIGLFDTLTFLEHFEPTNRPKTTAITQAGTDFSTPVPGVAIGANGTAVATAQLTPNIFREDIIKFSTYPTQMWNPPLKSLDQNADHVPVKWSHPNNNSAGNPFALAEGTPIFLQQASLQTIDQAALAYRAWWDISLDPGEEWVEMDFRLNSAQHPPLFRGPHKLDVVDDQVRTFKNKNKYKGISSIEVEFPNGLDSSTTTEDGRRFPSYANLYIYFEKDYDPKKYTVDAEFKAANIATAQAAVDAGNSNSNIVLMTDGHNEVNTNPNKRDFITNKYPLGECKLVEKSTSYVKFALSPFFIRGQSSSFHDAMANGKAEWVIQYNSGPNNLAPLNWLSNHVCTPAGGIPSSDFRSYSARMRITQPILFREWKQKGGSTSNFLDNYLPTNEKLNGGYPVVNGVPYPTVPMRVSSHVEWRDRSGKKHSEYYIFPLGGKYNLQIEHVDQTDGRTNITCDGLRAKFKGIKYTEGILELIKYERVPVSMDIDYSASQNVEAPEIADIPKEIGKFLENNNRPANSVVGNIIKIKGGIHETDTFDVMPN